MKMFLQSEAADCGLACLAMVASFHGFNSDFGDLRRRFPQSVKGVKLSNLVALADTFGFSARPLKLDLEQLRQLHLPCILHWDLNHFVVLKKVTSRHCVILDPSIGERKLKLSQVSAHFTGVGLELTPNAAFEKMKAPRRLSLRSLVGRTRGLTRALAQVLLIALVMESFAIVAPLFNLVVVDNVLSSGDSDLLTVLVLGFGLLLIIQTVIGLTRTFMVLQISQSIAMQWQTNLFSHLVHLPAAFFEKRSLGDLTSRFGATQEIQRHLTTSVIEAILDGLLAIIALVFMLAISVALTLVVVCAVIVYGLLRWGLYRPFHEASAERLVMAAKEQGHFIETLRAMTPLKLFGREDERRARWQNLFVDVQNRDVRTARLEATFQAARMFVFGLENLLVIWLGAKLIIDGQQNNSLSLTVGMLFAFVSYKILFISRVTNLVNHGIELKMLSLHAERLADIALEPPEVDKAVDNDCAHLAPSLELCNLSFRYSEGEPWILRGVNLRIAAGENVALTGPSGGGKTTLLKIVLGLLQPTEGEVLFGGVPVRHLGIRNFRRQVGTVMQDDVLLTGSLSDNICFFDSQPDLARIQACAEQAQIHEDINRMPMGYHTLVGDLGSGLSGGQRQRLLLARALYKKPRVLLLDEATSSLDLRNERAVTATLSQLSLARLVIAHRPETIAGAQRVVLLQEGQIVEISRQSAPSQVAATDELGCIAEEIEIPPSLQNCEKISSRLIFE